MPAFLIFAATESKQMAERQLGVSLIVLVLLVVVLVLDLRWVREGRAIAAELQLPKGQWVRYVKSLPIDPIIEVLVSWASSCGRTSSRTGSTCSLPSSAL